MSTGLSIPTFGNELSEPAQAVVDAALALSRDDQMRLLHALELSLSEPNEHADIERSRQTLSSELRRRLDDDAAGRDPGFSEEEVAAKVTILLESMR